MSDIFLSYAHQDELIANRVQHLLTLAGFNVISNKPVRPGESVSETLTRELENADGFIALLSKDYLESGWGQFELASAFVDDAWGSRRPIVPVLVDPQLKLRDLPPVLFDVHWLDARRGVDDSQLRSVIDILQTPAASSSQDQATRSGAVLDLRERVLRQQEVALEAEQYRRDQFLRVSLAGGLIAVVFSVLLAAMFIGAEVWGVALAALLGAVGGFLATLLASITSARSSRERRRG